MNCDNNPYEYYNDKLGVKLCFLISDKNPHPESLKLMTYRSLKWRLDSNTCGEQQLRKASLGVNALVLWDSLCQDWKAKLIKKFGEPKKQIQKSWFEQNYILDAKAHDFYRLYGYGEGETPLSSELIDKYTCQASVLNTVGFMIKYRKSKFKAMNTNTDFGKPDTDLWSNLLREVMALDVPHGFAFGSSDSFRKKYAGYVKTGYVFLISGKLNNVNRLAIKGDAAEWLLAQYCLPIKMSVPMLLAKYNLIRKQRGWKQVKERAINVWLDTPEIKRIWVLARDGKDEYNKLYSHRLQRDRSNWFPNAYWAIDGSKLDWIHYEDNDLGMAAKLKINPVIDVYSEKIIGWSISETENHTDHFTAIKQALNIAQTRPYLLNYDNQSGHKSARMQELYTNLVATDGGTHYPVKAYEKSNPAEQVFKRLQEQVVNQLWFSDKQSIKAKSTNSHPNMDFVKENKHRLYKKEELVKAWELCVLQWNNSFHPKFKDQTRNEVYHHPMAISEPIELLDMVNLFWVEETKGSIYKREGISIQIGHQTHTYEVYDSTGRIDIEFRRKYVGAKFLVRYDPEQLDQYVQLIKISATGEKTHIANAQPKRAHESIPALMKDGQKAQWDEDFKVRELEYERDLAAYNALVSRTGVSRESLIEEQDLMIKMGGDLPKHLRNDVEAAISVSRL